MEHDHILIVDDDQDLRELIAEILDDQGFAIRVCATAEEALEVLRQEQFKVAIIDNMMPGMGGMALLSLLKNQYPAIKAIMITAFSTVDNAVAAMKSGADDYLAKPFRRDELVMCVRRNLESLRFSDQLLDPSMDEALACLSNPIRRKILSTLAGEGGMRFMDLTRHLGIADHTKVNFHLKTLKSNQLISQDREKNYLLSPQGKKMLDCLDLLAKRISG